MATTVTKLPIINNILTGSSTDLVPSQNMTRNFGANQDFVEIHCYKRQLELERISKHTEYN
jgi:hypothetical protein